MKNYFIIVILLSFLTFSCAPTRFVEPLEKNKWSAGASIGGPVVGLGNVPIPAPLIALEGGYGVDSNITVFSGLQLTSAVFSNWHMDFGATFRVLRQKKFIPNISITPAFQFVADFQDKKAKFWPNLDVNAYWNYGKRRNYFYVGVSNYFELSKTLPHNQKQISRWLFSPQIGHVVKTKKQLWQFTLEMKFLAPYLSNEYAFLPYKSITGKYGATGFYIGIRRIIGGKK